MKKRLTENIGLKVLAFLAAIIMWFIVVNIDDPVSDKTFTGIPVQVINEEVVTTTNRTYQIVDDTQDVNVTVSAQRSVLDKIQAEDIVVTADMKELSLGTQIPLEVSIEGYRYEEAYTTPRNLQVQIDDEAKNNFPITPTTTGTVREGYIIGALTANPEKVTLRGPKTVIDSISRVTAEAEVSGLSEDATIEARLVLYDANNNVIDQTLLANNLGKEGVSVEVELYKIKSIPVKAETDEVTAADGYKIASVSVEPQEIQVYGPSEALRELNEIVISSGDLNAEELKEKAEWIIDISSYLPDGIELVDTNASSVVVSILIEQPGVQSYEVSVGSITVNDLSEDLELNYGSTVDLEIRIRGPEDTLEVFSIAKKVSIDLKDYTEPGTYTVPVAVELPQGCSLVSEVNVDVLLEEKQEE